MARLLGMSSQQGLDPEEEAPREVLKNPNPAGENGWLIRFFDSAFFCEWIAVSYLFKHEHHGVRDYLCNKMYTLPLTGIESYLLQLCFMMVRKSSASLEKFMLDGCSRSLKFALKVHWFLLAESEQGDDVKELTKSLDKCQMAALMGDWPPLVQPKKIETSPISKNRMLKLLSSRRLLNLTSSPPSQKVASAIASQIPIAEEETVRPSSEEMETSLNVFKKLMPGPKMRDAFLKKFQNKDEDDCERSKEGESESFFRRILKEKEEDEKVTHSDDAVSSESFFRRFFKDKLETEEKVVSKAGEEERFFRRFFRDRNEDREKGDGKEKPDEEEKGISTVDEDDGPEFSVFRRFFRVHPEEGAKLISNVQVEAFPESESSPGTDGFFKKLFRDRGIDDSKLFTLHREDGISPSSILKRLFKDKVDENGVAVIDNGTKAVPDTFTAAQHNEPLRDTQTIRNGFYESSDADAKGEGRLGTISIPTEISTKPSSDEKTVSVSLRRFMQRTADATLNSNGDKGPGSPKQGGGIFAAKPPLPKYSFFQLRKGTYHATLDFVQSLCDTSTGLVDIFPIEDRPKVLYESLAELNGLLVAQSDGGVCFPLGKGLYRVLHIPEDEAILLNSREKAPYLICVEVVKCDVLSTLVESKSPGVQRLSHGGIPLANGDVQLQKPPPWAYPIWNQSKAQRHNTDSMLRAASQAIDRAMNHSWETKVKYVHMSLSVSNNQDCAAFGHSENGPEHDDTMHVTTKAAVDTREEAAAEWVSVLLTAVPGVSMEDIDAEEPSRQKDHRRVPSTVAMAQVKAAAAKGVSPLGLPVKRNTMQTQSDDIGGLNGKATDALAGEVWEEKKERIRNISKFGNMSGWDLYSMIVKSGDDCRQEHLAVQLISHFYDIFQEAGLPLWLRPYEVLVTSSYTALIETIPDTASIHSIKSRNPSLSGLRDFFCNKFQSDTLAFKRAQTNFVESMAGYSILCYFLQVKDRHNGNLLIDEEGHIIHIDFGFMLSNSPGGVNFESAPFKLTRELLEVMDSDAEGTTSEFFDYFKVLCIQGFLTCRKHAERIILLVEMMQDSGFPCFKAGPKTIQNLRKRFHLSLTEEQCVSLVLSLISNSLDAWRTRQYDYYQRVLNGIL